MPNGEVDRRLATLSAWVTAGICFLIVFAISVMGVLVWQAQKTGQQAKALEKVATETHDSLCALKSDLQKRYVAGTKFLKENPKGIPGISAAQIKQSLSNQESTLLSLEPLDCD
jgi:cytochrome c-type biogenesis protein CcmH/NrfG